MRVSIIRAVRGNTVSGGGGGGGRVIKNSAELFHIFLVFSKFLKLALVFIIFLFFFGPPPFFWHWFRGEFGA